MPHISSPRSLPRGVALMLLAFVLALVVGCKGEEKPTQTQAEVKPDAAATPQEPTTAKPDPAATPKDPAATPKDPAATAKTDTPKPRTPSPWGPLCQNFERSYKILCVASADPDLVGLCGSLNKQWSAILSQLPANPTPKDHLPHEARCKGLYQSVENLLKRSPEDLLKPKTSK